MLAHRSLSNVCRAAFESRHYLALWNMGRLYPNVLENLGRYLLGIGNYPTLCRIRTPLGPIAPTLYSYYDMLTANEIFCRQDYAAGAGDRIILDLGSNIGLSALYFLTRGPAVKCTLVEPDPRNVDRLRANLADFEGRYVLHPCAVANRTGVATFGIDEVSGRYGGIGLSTGKSMQVECRHINTILTNVLEREGTIDILKIDVEGLEIPTLQAADTSLLRRVHKIYMEARPSAVLFPGLFDQKMRGTVCTLSR